MSRSPDPETQPMRDLTPEERDAYRAMRRRLTTARGPYPNPETQVGMMEAIAALDRIVQRIAAARPADAADITIIRKALQASQAEPVAWRQVDERSRLLCRFCGAVHGFWIGGVPDRQQEDE